jgi:hypothetical protein
MKHRQRLTEQNAMLRIHVRGFDGRQFTSKHVFFVKVCKQRRKSNVDATKRRCCEIIAARKVVLDVKAAKRYDSLSVDLPVWKFIADFGDEDA